MPKCKCTKGYIIIFQNQRGFLKNRCINTRLVCTPVNVFSCRIQIWQQKFKFWIYFFSLSWKIFTNRLLLITVSRGLTELICCWTCTPWSCFKFNLLWNTVLMPYLNLLHLYWMTRNYTGAAGYHFLFGFIKLLFLLDFFFFFNHKV